MLSMSVRTVTQVHNCLTQDSQNRKCRDHKARCHTFVHLCRLQLANQTLAGRTQRFGGATSHRLRHEALLCHRPLRTLEARHGDLRGIFPGSPRPARRAFAASIFPGFGARIGAAAQGWRGVRERGAESQLIINTTNKRIMASS